MTRRLVTMVCLITQLALASVAVAAQGATTVEDVLDRMAGALGGRERLARVRNVEVRSRIEAAGLTGTAVGVITSDGRTRGSYELGGVDRGESVFDGKTSWTRDANGKVREETGPELRSTVTSAYIESWSLLLPDRMRGRVELAGEDSTRTHYLLRVEPEGGAAVTLHVDKTTFLVDRIERVVDDRTSVRVLSDWRDVDGIKMPFAERSGLGDGSPEVVSTTTSVRFDVPVDEAAFRKPAEGPSDYTLSEHAGGIPFELTSNHIYLQVRVNGAGPLWFLFDTGASTTVVDMERAKQMGLKLEGQLQARGSGEGTLPASLVRDVTLEVPGARVAGQTVVAIPLESLEPFEGRQMDGIVGYDFTSRFVVEIDYAGRRIFLHEPKTYEYKGKGQRIPFTLEGNIPRVQARVVGPGNAFLGGLFTVDTGSRAALSLNTPFVRDHAWTRELADRAVAAPHGIGVGGETKTRVGRLQALVLGTYAVENLVTGFSFDEKGADASPDHAGNIGGEVLRRFTVVFDYSRSAMYLEPNRSFAEPFEYDMLGALLKLDGTAFVVHRVVAGSAAERAGLKPGDAIVAIDGRSTSELSLNDARALFRREGGSHALTVRRGEKTSEVRVQLKRIV